MMRKFVFTLLAILVIASTASAQWQYKNGKMYLKPYSAYVGIGTDSPTSALYVAGDIVATGTISQLAGAATATTLTVSGLATFTLTSGQITIDCAADTNGVAIAGLTTSGIAVVSYGEQVGAVDTVAQVVQIKAGWLQVMGERGKKVNYWIPKK